jgi:predicted metal-binding membrane protein
VSAWAILALWSASPYAELLSHAGIGEGNLSPIARLLAFGLGWLLMSIAMMLPGSLPLLERLGQAFGDRPQHDRRVARFLLGYLLIWATFGWLAYLGDMVIHQAVEHSSVLEAAASGIMPAVLLVAGIYQLTRMKRSYLAKCRSAHSVRPAQRDALRLGVAHGLTCLGSCWALMLFMFAMGGMHLGWMLLLGVVMTAERTARWGPQLTRPIGLVLILSAVVSLAAMLSLFPG